MAYVKEIWVRDCFRCGKKATPEVYSTRNALINYACRRHAEEQAAKLTKQELEA